MRWARLPIFPLPGVQLFPHALLPLHVFEPRYRDMVRDAMAGERLIAVASFEPGYETNYQGRPAVRPIIGVGAVVGHEALDEGRANIVLRGLARARIEHELPPAEAYRVVEAARIDDVIAAGFDTGAARDTLVLLADQLALKLPVRRRDLARAGALAARSRCAGRRLERGAGDRSRRSPGAPRERSRSLHA